MTSKQPRDQEGLALTDWRALPRSEMLENVIVAVDTGRCEALAHQGEDAPYARYCERALFPFLEAEKEKALEAEREYEEDFAYLTERVGATEEDARLRLRDGDLWLLDPIYRFGEELEGEEGVRHWQRTVQLARAFGDLAANEFDRSNPAATQLIWDAADRAAEALRRVRERTEEAAGDAR